MIMPQKRSKFRSVTTASLPSAGRLNIHHALGHYWSQSRPIDCLIGWAVDEPAIWAGRTEWRFDRRLHTAHMPRPSPLARTGYCPANFARFLHAWDSAPTSGAMHSSAKQASAARPGTLRLQTLRFVDVRNRPGHRLQNPNTLAFAVPGISP